MINAKKYLFVKPKVAPKLDPHFARTNKGVQMGMLYSIPAHLFSLILFIYFELPWLIIINALSTAVYVLLYFVSRTNRNHTALLFTALEGKAFALSVTYFAGWESGYYLWLVFEVLIIFIGYRWTPLSKGLLLLLSFSCLIFAVSVLKQVAPYYQIDPNLLDLIYIFNLFNLMLTASVVFYILSKSSETAEIHLHRAHKRTRELLLNILPAKIADRLEKQTGVIADSFSEISILFCDLVGFTRFSDSLPAEDVVKILNEIFTGFDRIVLSLGLEKIKTIGDGYMVAAGIPEKMENHAFVIVECAQQMLTFIEDFNREYEINLQLRLGINSGNVVAGIIGANKFTYDLWGDTVNVAARMESHGVPGKIHISQATHNLIQESYPTQSRGEITVKGKGNMETYFVE